MSDREMDSLKAQLLAASEAGDTATINEILRKAPSMQHVALTPVWDMAPCTYPPASSPLGHCVPHSISCREDQPFFTFLCFTVRPWPQDSFSRTTARMSMHSVRCAAYCTQQPCALVVRGRGGSVGQKNREGRWKGWIDV